MRLDKFIGKARSETEIRIYDKDSNLLYIIDNATDFKQFKEILKKYKVGLYKVFENSLIVTVKERNND